MPRITELVGRHWTLGQADEDSALGVGIHKRAFIRTWHILVIRCSCKMEKRENSDWNGCQALAWQLSCLCCWLAGCHRTRCTADKDCALYLKCGDSPHTTVSLARLLSQHSGRYHSSSSCSCWRYDSLQSFYWGGGNSGYTLLTMWTIHSSVWRWLWHPQRHILYIMPL